MNCSTEGAVCYCLKSLFSVKYKASFLCAYKRFECVLGRNERFDRKKHERNLCTQYIETGCCFLGTLTSPEVSHVFLDYFPYLLRSG